MKIQLRLRAIAVLPVIVISSVLAQESALDSVIPVERQEDLGLDALSAEQKEALLGLLSEIYQAGVQEGRRSSPQQIGAPATSTPSAIESKVDGEFEGWEGETIVRLVNGQIWEQVEYYYHYHYAYMPDVLIYPSNGTFKMKVEGVDRAVGVRQIK